MVGFIYLSGVSVICGVMTLFLGYKRLALLLIARRAKGRLVRWEVRGLRKMYYYPVVEFEAVDGHRYEFMGAVGSSRKQERSEYVVFYPVDRPASAMIGTFTDLCLPPLGFLVLALAAGLAAFQQI
jgi:hypothetical protein